jgi:hypothetical protein
MASDTEPRDEEVLTILLYASNRATREDVRLALGRKVAADLPHVRVLEVATQPALLAASTSRSWTGRRRLAEWACAASSRMKLCAVHRSCS